MKIGIGIALMVSILGCAISAADAAPAGNFQWKCTDTGRNSMQCIVKNTGYEDNDICMDVVKICKDGEHISMFCSGTLRPNESDTKVVKDFEPKVRFLAGCMGVEYRNKVSSR